MGAINHEFYMQKYERGVGGSGYKVVALHVVHDGCGWWKRKLSIERLFYKLFNLGNNMKGLEQELQHRI